MLGQQGAIETLVETTAHSAHVVVTLVLELVTVLLVNKDVGIIHVVVIILETHHTSLKGRILKGVELSLYRRHVGWDHRSWRLTCRKCAVWI